MRNRATTQRLSFGVAVTLSSVLAFVATPSRAALINRGGGLIYDTTLNVTWMQDANLAATNTFEVAGISGTGRMSWTTAQSWIAAMNGTSYKGYNDWRLPTLSPVNGTLFFNDTLTVDGSSDLGTNTVAINQTASEMAHLFYHELGNTSSCNRQFGGLVCPGSDLANTGPFHNINLESYWSGVDHAGPAAWTFNFPTGFQGVISLDTALFAMVVRTGDVAPVPVPAALALLLPAICALGFARRNV